MNNHSLGIGQFLLNEVARHRDVLILFSTHEDVGKFRRAAEQAGRLYDFIQPRVHLRASRDLPGFKTLTPDTLVVFDPLDCDVAGIVQARHRIKLSLRPLYIEMQMEREVIAW